jgi:hypothetical protein
MEIETFSDDQLTMFFNIWEMVRTNDRPEIKDLDSKLKNLARKDKQKALDFFQYIIDQPAFMTNDHKMLRKLIIDWYAASRTIVSRSALPIDVFKMTNNQLDEMILSFGFPYPNRIITNQNKALFLLDLMNLYKKKGTPESLTRALQYFGLQNIRLSEWWIHKKETGLFVARSKVILPRTHANDSYTEIAYVDFIANDPYWRLTLSDLEAEYETSKISLPSLTPHFSIDASINISSVYPVTAIIVKKIQEAYGRWLVTGEIEQDIIISRYGLRCSFLELVLSIGYLFRSNIDGSGSTIYEYQGAIDRNSDGIDDTSYDSIYDLYDRISAKPDDRATLNANLANWMNNFTGNKSDLFVQSYAEVGTIIEDINPELKSNLDNDILSGNDTTALEVLLYSLDGYLESIIELTNFSLAHMIYGSSTYERLKPIINFFKPYRSRVRELLTTFTIDEPLLHSVRIDDPESSISSTEHPDDVGLSDIHSTETDQTDIDFIRNLDGQTKEDFYLIIDNTDIDENEVNDTDTDIQTFYLCDKFDEHFDAAVCTDELIIDVIDV